MRRKRPAFWWFVAGPAVVLGAVLVEAFPFFAMTGTSGGRTLVVEGWMDPGALKQAAQLALDSGYSKVYTTGTVRGFSYYLGSGEAVAVDLREAHDGTLSVDVSGTTHAGFYLIDGADTLMDQLVSPKPFVYKVTSGRALRRLRITAWSIPLEAGTPEIFIRMLEVGGVNAHLLQSSTRFIHPDGSSSPAWPTYAQYARAQMVEFGVPAGNITAVPAFGSPKSRSWANAHAFGQQARTDGITACDVATVGVHARRSQALFQTACGPGINVGVIALHDPFCTRANWWRSFRGWYTMMKEVLGTSEVQAVEIAH